MNKTIVIFVLLIGLTLISCKEEGANHSSVNDTNPVTNNSIGTETTINDTFENLNTLQEIIEPKKRDTLTNHSESYNETDKLTPEEQLALDRQNETIRIELLDQIKHFFFLLNNDNFDEIQEMLHPEGLYYYSRGRIEPKDFNLVTLNETWMMEYYDWDCYCVKEREAGLVWLGGLKAYYSEKTPEILNYYPVPAYGTTGNNSSPHTGYPNSEKESDSYDYKANYKIKVAYIRHFPPPEFKK